MDLNNLIFDVRNYAAEKGNCLNGVHYEDLCKLTAKLCFSKGRHSEGIFYLSEAHGASVRVETLHQYELCEAKHETKGTAFSPNLDRRYLDFCNEYARNNYEGLCRRLSELPKEWTIVQLTRSYIPSELWSCRQTNSVPQIGDLHISRFSCGESGREPCHVLVPEPRCGDHDGTTNILRMLYNITLDRSLHLKTESVSRIKNKRLQNSSLLRVLVREVQTQWLKEWCWMLLGKICDKQLEQSIEKRLKDAFDELKIGITCHVKRLLTELAFGSAHLSDENIDSAVGQLIDDFGSQRLLVERICEIRNEYSQLMKTKRYPVILLVDQKLEIVPWEVCPVLKNHPVSRLPSIHFVHAIFKHHESTIIDGNKILSAPPSGFFIVNPDTSLQNTEKRILQFLKLRSSKWNGVVGEAPSPSDFLDVLGKYDILLYCGHGNGTQYLNSYNIQELKVKAIPFLFGCSSVQHNDIGGRLSFRSLSNSYLMAASPCALGMLWNVTNTDTDYMALTLLNHWLPGKPIDLRKIEGFGSAQFSDDDRSFKELELLRVLRSARDSASMFTNGAAMVVYGIPVKLSE